MADEQVRFTYRDATPGQPCWIQRSPSLAEGSWTDWLNFTYNGPIGLMDLETGAAAKKFYRAVSP